MNSFNWKSINNNHFECTECKTRSPESAKTCFYCGSNDTIKFNPISEKDKLKSPIKGATIVFK